MAFSRIVNKSDQSDVYSVIEREQNEYKLMVCKMETGTRDPKRSYVTSAGLDLICPYDISIIPRHKAVIDTGLKVVFPTKPVRTFGQIGEQLKIFICF